MGLTLERINKVVEGEHHLADISLDLKAGSRHVILGRTLAGKTSLLRIMAGLDRPTSGRLRVDGQDVTGVSVRKRSVAMVYQQFINYPSFTVYNNIASPLKVSGVPADEIKERVMDTARVLHLEPMLDRLPSELSGGQQQRVAIARALMKDTDLLLLDEPLVNLDYKLREELLEELQAIFDQRKSVVVYTTTEPSEALKLGGNIVVMDEGKVLQTGETSNVYRNPATVKTAELFSDPPINFFNGRIEADKVVIGQDLSFSTQAPFNTLETGSYQFGIRPNHLFLNPQADDDVQIRSKVEISEINGSETFIHFKFDGCQTVLHEVGIDTRKSGSDITAYVNPKYFFVYSQDGNLLVSPDGQASPAGQGEV
ncbi:MAG TPA: ABC transporter [Desulfobacteraceae bacterium]|nr:ABC transporter [Desulfobacteraceae bacterium]